MGYDATIKKYLRSIQKEYENAKADGQHTAELSFRIPLHTLFQGLAKDLNPSSEISVILEPKNQGKVGRPDWRIHDTNTLGIYGYIEAKGPSEDPFDTTPYQKQIKKYLSLDHNLVITDGIDFVFAMKTRTKPVVISLIDKSKMSLKNWDRQTINPQFKLFMSDFFASPSPQELTEDRLVEQVAKRTRNLADDIIQADISADEAADSSERAVVELFANIRKLIYNHNDASMRNEKVFSDFVAQVIMFSLLYAHRALCDNSDSPSVKEAKIRDFIYKDLTDDEILLPFRNLMVYLRDNGVEDLFIGQWIDECIKFLSFVKMTDERAKVPDYHALFETFLEKYDAQSRFDYGAYYTPQSLASFIVKFTNGIVQKSLNESIYGNGNTIVDPCCGTGSFLEQIIRQDPGDSDYTLGGIEILPAPYMLANYRLSVVEKELHHKNHNNVVILANTLCNGVFDGAVNENTIEGRELKRANKLSTMPLKLVIGNPPCSDAKREQRNNEEFSIIDGLMNDFRPPASGRHSRQNTQKQINNPFMQFIRWSCKMLLEQRNNSVLSFVVPLSFLDSESYQYARKYLCEHFNKAWVVAIDADARTGVRTDSLFNTLQGRAMIVFLKQYGVSEQVRSFAFADCSQKRKVEKEDFFNLPLDSLKGFFKQHDVDEHYKLFPTEPIDKAQYDKFWPISDSADVQSIFVRHCSGIKLAFTPILTCVKEGMLKRKCKEILSGGYQAAREWVKESGQKFDDKPENENKVLDFQTRLHAKGNASKINDFITKNTKKYSFRPFIMSYVFLWRDLLQDWRDFGGGGTRYRNEIINAYDNKETIGFSVAHAPKTIDSDLGQFVSFCWYYPDNDLCSRGNGNIYMNQYPSETDDGKMDININADLLQSVIIMTGDKAEDAAKEVVFYCYACLCSQTYLEKYRGALYIPNQSDARARVPIVAEKDIFERLAVLGNKVAILEKDGHIADNVLHFDYDKIEESFPEGFRLSHKCEFDEEREKLILKSGKTTFEVDCPLNLQKLVISGYPVVKNWIKFHSFGATHMEFSKEGIEDLLNFLNTLQVHTNYVAEIDTIMEDILEDKYEYILPVLGNSRANT